MIERLKSEHRSFESKIAKVQDSINNDDIVIKQLKIFITYLYVITRVIPP